MRALAAGLTVFLGLGVMGALATTMAGCSDSTDAGGTGGASGSSSAGAGGASAGKSGSGDAGSTGECAFLSDTCTSCIQDSCGDELTACSMDGDCGTALAALPNCVCTKADPTVCQTSFVMDGGSKAAPLAACFAQHCSTACQ